jgi:hypothetical protein
MSEEERFAAQHLTAGAGAGPLPEFMKQALANKATLFIQKKLAEGWIPQPGILETE